MSHRPVPPEFNSITCRSLVKESKEGFLEHDKNDEAYLNLLKGVRVDSTDPTVSTLGNFVVVIIFAALICINLPHCLAIPFKTPSAKFTLSLQRVIKFPCSLCRYHPKKFISLSSNSNTYKNSFITRTVTDWNSLPANVIDQTTMETFKAALKEHFIKLEYMA